MQNELPFFVSLISYLNKVVKIKNENIEPEIRSTYINLVVREIRADLTKGLINPPTKNIN